MHALTAVTRYSTLFWVLTLCVSERTRRFREPYGLHSRPKSEPGNKLADAGGGQRENLT
jgi:hypothetical protein